jgi:hypothetical protein
MEIKRKIQIGFISFMVLSILGYIYHPIITACLDLLFIWGVHLRLKKLGIKTTYFKKKK